MDGPQGGKPHTEKMVGKQVFADILYGPQYFLRPRSHDRIVPRADNLMRKAILSLCFLNIHEKQSVDMQLGKRICLLTYFNNDDHLHQLTQLD